MRHISEDKYLEWMNEFFHQNDEKDPERYSEYISFLIEGKDNGKLFLEVGYNQGDAVSKLLLDSFNKIEVVKDYSNNDRIIVAEKSTKEG